jgi:hypothetical protein
MKGFFLICLFAAAAAQAESSKYSLEDLSKLEQQKSWSELAQHLNDIPPAQRNERWQTIAKQAALGVMEEVGNEQDHFRGLLWSEDLLSTNPSLKAHKDFMKKRGEIGLIALKDCFGHIYDTADCGEYLKKFTAKDPDNLDLWFDAGKLARSNMKHWAAVPYFKRALLKPSDKRSCKDEDVRLAIVAGMDSPETSIQKDSSALAETCWSDVKNAVVAEFSGSNSTFKQNVCPLLKSKKALGPAALASCPK